MVTKDLGMVTAYAYAVAGGYTGTEAEFTQLMADLAVVVDDFDNFSVNVTTLPAGSSATASYSDGVLSLGIPKGDKGDKGNTGNTPDFGIGTVTTLSAGSSATASITGTAENPVLNLGIPEGQAGSGAVGTVASAYSSSSTYAVGDYVIHNSNLYRCTTAITTAEAFTAAHWTQVVLGDDVSDLKSDFDNFSVFTKGTGVDSAILVESEGESPVASGERSVAIGSRSNASGDCSFAGGSHATINGTTYVPTASGTNSFAYGAGALASGVSSFAFGAHNSAVGVATATGNASVSMGLACKATNTGSVALGTANNASGSASVALGLMNNAKEAGQMAIGRYNADEPTAKFIVGSGSSSSDRVNCFSAGVNANSEFYIKVGSVELTATQLTALLALLTQ